MENSHVDFKRHYILYRLPSVLLPSKMRSEIDEILEKYHENEISLLIIDFSLVSTLTTEALTIIRNFIISAQLLGGKCRITGISPELAPAISDFLSDIPNVKFSAQLADSLNSDEKPMSRFNIIRDHITKKRTGIEAPFQSILERSQMKMSGNNPKLSERKEPETQKRRIQLFEMMKNHVSKSLGKTKEGDGEKAFFLRQQFMEKRRKNRVSAKILNYLLTRNPKMSE